MTDITRGEWVNSFLSRCSYLTTPDNLVGTLTWIRAEWGSAAPIPAKYNPLSVVTPLNGSTKFNDVGVQKFKTFDDGVEATKLTLLNGDYLGIREALGAGNDDHAMLAAIAASRWGSKPTIDFLQYTWQHLGDELALPIGPASTAAASFTENNMIIQPNKPMVPGRYPFAILDIPNKRVLLYNGASVGTPNYPDQKVADYRVWPVPSIHAIVGMVQVSDGIIVGASDGSSFHAFWR